jgi:hypothetical protein
MILSNFDSRGMAAGKRWRTKSRAICLEQQHRAIIITHSNSDKPLQSNSGKPLQSNSGKPLQIESGQPLQSKSGKPLQGQSGKPLHEARATSCFTDIRRPMCVFR